MVELARRLRFARRTVEVVNSSEDAIVRSGGERTVAGPRQAQAAP